MKKRLSFISVIVLIAFILCGCGEVKGTYTPAGGKTASELSSIRFDGKSAVFTLGGYSVGGTYSIKGDTLELNYEMLGKQMSRTVQFSQKGNSLFLDGVEYVSQSSGGGKALVTVLIILVLLAVLAAAYFLLLRPHFSGKTGKGSETTDEQTGSPLKKVRGFFARKTRDDELFEDDYDEDEYEDEYDEGDDADEPEPVHEDASKKVITEEEQPEENDDGVRVWRPEATSRVEPEEAEESEEPDDEIIPITADRCCVCGKPLNDEYTVLARLPSGGEARIDRVCHKALYILSNTTSQREFDKAAGYLEVRMNRTDPLVANSLRRFIRKEELRLDSESDT